MNVARLIRLRGRALAQDRRAVAAVELGLISAIVLVPLIGGTVGLGQGLAIQNKLDRGVHAGLVKSWGMGSALTAANVSSNIVGAVQDGYGATPAPTATAVLNYYCISPTGTRSGTGSTTTLTCTSPQIQATYVVIAASATFTPLIPVPITGWNRTGNVVTISSTATVRIQ